MRFSRCLHAAAYLAARSLALARVSRLDECDVCWFQRNLIHGETTRNVVHKRPPCYERFVPRSGNFWGFPTRGHPWQRLPLPGWPSARRITRLSWPAILPSPPPSSICTASTRRIFMCVRAGSANLVDWGTLRGAQVEVYILEAEITACIPIACITTFLDVQTLLTSGYGLDPSSTTVLTVAPSSGTYSYALGAMITFADELGWTFVDPPSPPASTVTTETATIVGLAVATGVSVAAALALGLALFLRSRARDRGQPYRSPFELALRSASVEPSPLTGALAGSGGYGGYGPNSHRAPGDAAATAASRQDRVATVMLPSDSVKSENPLASLVSPQP